MAGGSPIDGMVLKTLSLLLLVLGFGRFTLFNGQTAEVQKNSLLGKWVCIANNADKRPKEKLEFHADGVATLISAEGKSMTVKYKREPLKEWWARRSKEIGDPEVSNAGNPYDIPGGEVILLAKAGSNFDNSGMMLILDPNNRLLTAPMTQVWCRPSEEAHAREITGIAKHEKEMAQWQKRVEAWRPKVDISRKWKLLWSIKLPDFLAHTGSVATYGNQIFVPDKYGFSICENGKRKYIRIPQTKDQYIGNFVALGRSNGKLRLALFGVWDQTLDVYDTSGHLVWKYDTQDRGIDWVTPLQTDDQNVGFAISYNADGGVECVGPDGKLRWKTVNGSNTWNICSAQLSKGKTRYAVSTDDKGAQAYDSRGKKLRHFDSDAAGAVYAADLNNDGIDEVFTLRTTGEEAQDRLTAFSATGKKLWSADSSGSGVGLVEGVPMFSGTFGGQRLLGIADGTSLRFLKANGKPLGDWRFKETVEAVTVLHSKSGDLLVVRLDTGLRCYKFTG